MHAMLGNAQCALNDVRIIRHCKCLYKSQMLKRNLNTKTLG